jgi:hypothetical protein
VPDQAELAEQDQRGDQLESRLVGIDWVQVEEGHLLSALVDESRHESVFDDNEIVSTVPGCTRASTHLATLC